MFSLQKIGSAAANRQTYLRGVSDYNSGKVRQFVRSTNAFYDEYLTAAVEGSEPDVFYRVEVGFNHAGEAEYFECDCPTYHEYDGACKHIVAVMVQKYYADMVSGLTTAGQMMGRQTPVRVQSDAAARQMMHNYLNREATLLFAETAVPEEPVQLIPLSEMSGHQMKVSLSIGGKRLYLVKDIGDFCRRMTDGETFSYGKQLQFLHVPASFAEASRPLLAFVRREYADLQVSARSGYVQGKFGRELSLSPGALDRFFTLFTGKCVDMHEEFSTESITFLERDPVVNIAIQRAPNGGGLHFVCENVRSISGASSLYVRQDAYLYRCSEDFTAHMEEWLRAAYAKQTPLFVADEDLGEFCSSVLPVISPYVHWEGDLTLLETHLPQHLELEIYLDAPARDTVSARLLCCYGEEKINPYAGGEIAPYRDRLAEMKARLVLQKYFSAYIPANECLVFHGTDEKIFRFVEMGVDELAHMGTVFATDAFKKAGVGSAPKISVGVSLAGDLLTMDLQIEDLDLEELGRLLSGYRQNKRFHRLRSGQFIQLDDTALAALAEMAEGLSLSEKELRTGHIRLPKYRAMYLDRMLREQEDIQCRRDTHFKDLVRNMKSVADSDFPVPESLAGVLRNYQKTGYRWLKTMEQVGFGGILADDMGLGKTLQILALLLDAKERDTPLSSLVVCPTSLVFNWESEIHRFVPSLTVLPIVGDAAARAELLKSTDSYDVVVTSYDLLKRDISLYEDKRFHYHILDEAQCIKNHTTQNAKAVKSIVSTQRFALTGTPIENRLSELWSIFDFLMPGFLYAYHRFKENFEMPIVKNGDKTSLTRLSKMTSPFILRRLKREVLKELPPKTESVSYAVMEDSQRQLYLANVAQVMQEVKDSASEKSKFTILALLTRLRQLCCDPSLCYENYEGGSCKLESCMELLHEAAEAGHKVLLFSQFTSMLEIIEKRLQAEGLTSYMLRGSTPKEKRAALVDNFNIDDTNVFLISLKAGGTGLNLTGADLVIHFDPWWNMSAQNQATDRAHRIGQKNPVQVVKLIAKDTVEEKILKLQESKQDLANAVIVEGGNVLSDMTPAQLLDILG